MSSEGRKENIFGTSLHTYSMMTVRKEGGGIARLGLLPTYR